MNIRDMIDTTTGLTLPTHETKTTFQKNQDVVIKRQTNRSGPTTFEVKAAKIVSLDGNMATVLVAGPMGVQAQKVIPVAQLEAVSDSQKRKLMQFNPQMRGML
jgi:hypothetical protein